MKIIWSPTAQNDLQRIAALIALDKRVAAIQWATKVRKKVSRLKRFPYSGRIVPELKRADVREVIIGSYRVIYRVDAQISILSVFHGAKLVE